MKHAPYLFVLLSLALTACGPEIAGPEFREVETPPASTEIDCSVSNPPPECNEDGIVMGSNG